jgi:hypothetical protein
MGGMCDVVVAQEAKDIATTTDVARRRRPFKPPV